MSPICVRTSRLMALLATLLLAPAALAESDQNAPLTVTTFNIKFFGVNGNPDNALGSETRVATIRQHLTRENLWSDVMIFEEIVDVALLEDSVLGSGYNCQSYDHANEGHQHVVICHKRTLTLAKASDEDDFVIEDVSLGEDRYRPAVHGIIKNRSGRALLHVIGVHLKASPEYSSTRMQQVDIIADYLDQRVDTAPVVLTGDFNTYGEDTANISRVLGSTGQGLVEIETAGNYTWRSGARGNKFDHVWVSSDLAASSIRIAGPCNSADRAQISTYNQNVSDHCPVTLTVSPLASHR